MKINVSDDGVDADDDDGGDDDDDSGNAKMIVWTSSYVKEWLGWHQASLVMVRTLNREDDVDDDSDSSIIGTQMKDGSKKAYKFFAMYITFSFSFNKQTTYRK